MPDATEKAYGCLCCFKGKEEAVAEQVRLACPEVRLTPVRQEKYRSVNGRKHKVVEVALPGYVFFEAANRADAVARFPKDGVVQLLSYEGGDWRLKYSDEAFARRVFSYDGILGFSKAYGEGDHIRIASGPLKDMEGQIVRVDRRGRSGQVALTVDGRSIRIWLGFELIDTDSGGFART